MGYHCVDCVAQGRRSIREPVTIAGAKLRAQPIVVPALIVTNVVIFVITAIQAGSGTQNTASELFESFALWPILVGAGEWWRLIGSGFLHIGLTHLIMNMIALWVIGRDLEQVLGRLRFSAVYALSLIGGSTAIFLFADASRPVAGASGAVFGLMGGIAVTARRLKVSMRPVLIVIALNVAVTLAIPVISVQGHFGGLVIGAAATAALVYAPRQKRTYWQVGALTGLFVVLVVMLVLRDLSLGDLVCWDSPLGRQCGVRA